jgi:hypothetical protein
MMNLEVSVLPLPLSPLERIKGAVAHETERDRRGERARAGEVERCRQTQRRLYLMMMH